MALSLSPKMPSVSSAPASSHSTSSMLCSNMDRQPTAKLRQSAPNGGSSASSSRSRNGHAAGHADGLRGAAAARMSEPALDELPGSLQNGTPDQEKEDGSAWSARASAASSSAVPAAGRAGTEARRRGQAAGRAGSGEEKRRRTKRKATQRQLQQEEAERRTVAKHERQSNILLGGSAAR